MRVKPQRLISHLFSKTFIQHMKHMVQKAFSQNMIKNWVSVNKLRQEHKSQYIYSPT